MNHDMPKPLLPLFFLSFLFLFYEFMSLNYDLLCDLLHICVLSTETMYTSLG